MPSGAPRGRCRGLPACSWGFSVPLSTSLTGVAAGIVLAAFVLRGEGLELLRHWKRPMVLAPIAIFALVILGIAWTPAPWEDVFHHLSKYVKLLFIPMLMFLLAGRRRPEWSLAAFVCGIALACAISLVHFCWPTAGFWPRPLDVRGVPFGTYHLLNLAAVVAMHAAVLFAARQASGNRWLALAAMVLAALLCAHIAFIAPSRTGVLVLLASLAVLVWQLVGRRGLVAGVLTALLCGAVLYAGVPGVRERFDAVPADLAARHETGHLTSSGIRLALWQRGLEIALEAPVFGHGTGSMRSLYAQAETGITHDDPHNQFLAMAIPFGVIGLAALFALWVAQLSFFSGGGYFNLLGQAAVVQTIVTSFFNSTYTSFGVGWLFVFVIGCAAAGVWARAPPRSIGTGGTPP